MRIGKNKARVEGAIMEDENHWSSSQVGRRRKKKKKSRWKKDKRLFLQNYQNGLIQLQGTCVAANSQYVLLENLYLDGDRKGSHVWLAKTREEYFTRGSVLNFIASVEAKPKGWTLKRWLG